MKHGHSLRRLHFSYEFGGRTLQHSALTQTQGPHGNARPGDELWILVDPRKPSRVWLLEQFVP